MKVIETYSKIRRNEKLSYLQNLHQGTLSKIARLTRLIVHLVALCDVIKIELEYII